MALMKKMTVNAQEYIVTLRRFDDVIDPAAGAEYHGYYIGLCCKKEEEHGKLGLISKIVRNPRYGFVCSFQMASL
jgi:hypothetical protein